MAAVAILKIRKIATSPNGTTNFDEIWHADASRPSPPNSHIKVILLSITLSFRRRDGGYSITFLRFLLFLIHGC